jgi:hypothetical protein
LLGEEVNTQVSVLTSCSRGGDADDLARTTLKDQEIADADVVAGDGNSVGRTRGFNRALGSSLRSSAYLNVNFFRLMVVLVMMMRFSIEDTVTNTVSRLVETVAEGVVVTWAGLGV